MSLADKLVDAAEEAVTDYHPARVGNPATARAAVASTLKLFAEHLGGLADEISPVAELGYLEGFRDAYDTVASGLQDIARELENNQ